MSQATPLPHIPLGHLSFLSHNATVTALPARQLPLDLTFPLYVPKLSNKGFPIFTVKQRSLLGLKLTISPIMQR